MRRRTLGIIAATASVLAFAAVGADPAQAAASHADTRVHHSGDSAAPAEYAGNLEYMGGPVVSTPAVYIVYWGSQWGTGSAVTKDPSGEAALQLSFFQHLYGSGDTWSTSTTQYCSGIAVGTTQCGPSNPHVGHPSSNPVRGTWLDHSVSLPLHPTDTDIAAEAAAAAAHFGVSGVDIQIIVDLPHGVAPYGFHTGYCSYHDYTTGPSGGVVPFTNFPYMTDAGSACGANFVATGSSGVNGATEGVTIVAGHEYAETLTDPEFTGWTYSGEEAGDKCIWLTTGQGAAIVSINGTNFAVQGLWSNSFNGGTGGCVTSYAGPTKQH